MSSTSTHGCNLPAITSSTSMAAMGGDGISRSNSGGSKSNSSYLKMPLKYMGGKSKLLDFIKSAIPSNGVPGRWVEPLWVTILIPVRGITEEPRDDSRTVSNSTTSFIALKWMQQFDQMTAYHLSDV